jgi:hypothetical protein
MNQGCRVIENLQQLMQETVRTGQGQRTGQRPRNKLGTRSVQHFFRTARNQPSGRCVLFAGVFGAGRWDMREGVRSALSAAVDGAAIGVGLVAACLLILWWIIPV